MSRKSDGYGGYHTTIKKAVCDACGNTDCFRVYSVRLCDNCFTLAQDKRKSHVDYNTKTTSAIPCACCVTKNVRLGNYNICESCWVPLVEHWR